MFPFRLLWSKQCEIQALDLLPSDPETGEIHTKTVLRSLPRQSCLSADAVWIQSPSPGAYLASSGTRTLQFINNRLYTPIYTQMLSVDTLHIEKITWYGNNSLSKRFYRKRCQVNVLGNIIIPYMLTKKSKFDKDASFNFLPLLLPVKWYGRHYSEFKLIWVTVFYLYHFKIGGKS